MKLRLKAHVKRANLLDILGPEDEVVFHYGEDPILGSVWGS